MSRLRLQLSISLDGFAAGPDQSVKKPLGIGGMRLHDWVFPLQARRAMHGETGGELNDSNAVLGGLELARTVAAPAVTHLKFAKR